VHVLCLAVPSALLKRCCLIDVYLDKLNDDDDDDDEDDDKDRTCSSGDMLADRQTDRRGHRNAAVPCRGGVTMEVCEPSHYRCDINK